MKNDTADISESISTLASNLLTTAHTNGHTIPDAIIGLGEMILDAVASLGNGDANDEMGAIEAHGLAIKTGSENIASAIRELAEAIRAKE